MTIKRFMEILDELDKLGLIVIMDEKAVEDHVEHQIASVEGDVE